MKNNERAKLTNISLFEYFGSFSRYELRLDWSNDRHQAIGFAANDADGISEALLKAAKVVKREKRFLDEKTST
jgi:hypothetical protein